MKKIFEMAGLPNMDGWMGDTASTVKNNLLLFFYRPNEPCFMQKGDERAVFDIPENYYPDKYKKLSKIFSTRFGFDASRTIPVRNIALPDLSLPLQLPYKEQFSLFVPQHRQMAGNLVDIFIGMRDLEDLQSVCAYCQLHINPYMFNYCLSVALLHRDDTKGLSIPNFVESFPDKFFDPKVFRRAREVSNVVPPGTRRPVVIPVHYTASDLEPEQAVAYFREDIGLNLHHWHWHLVYPFDGKKEVVNKDRRGELFYYMHQQVIARYNVERLCNNLGLVKRYKDLRAPISEGYFPKLNSQVAGRTWPPRFSNTIISDINRPIDLIKGSVSDLETWRDRLLQAVEDKAILLSNNSTMPLSEETGIDILGNLVESSSLSLNRGYYGDLHNMGHIFISYSHDPDNRHLEQFAVMGDTATAMRDPVFYRWHSYIDDILNLYKTKLPPYDRNKLDFPGISVVSVSIEGFAGTDTLGTQWEQSTVELSRGMDFMPQGSVMARFTHLQHDEFRYIIEVNNSSDQERMGMFRIFIAPVLDAAGQPLELEEQRRLMIEMDKFSHQVTIPYERTFRSQAQRPGAAGSEKAAEFDFCGCGWPHHLLVPKGTIEGYPCVLFVMVSNWDEDRVQQDTVGACSDAASYCGVRDHKYPDIRAMGYPFDRPASAATLMDFLTPNMGIKDISIKHSNTTRIRGKW